MKNKKQKSKIEVGFNALGMPIFLCDCREKGCDALSREQNICDKCMGKVKRKLEMILK